MARSAATPPRPDTSPVAHRDVAVPRPAPARRALVRVPGRLPSALLAAALLIVPLRAEAVGEAPPDARLFVDLDVLGVVVAGATLPPNTFSGWDVDAVLEELGVEAGEVEAEIDAEYDPFVDFRLSVENRGETPLPVRMTVFASMQPQFAGAPLAATGEILLTDGTSTTAPDGEVSFLRSEAADDLARAFVRSFDGQIRSFGFFEQSLFAEDLTTAGIHRDDDEGVVAFDAADAFAPGTGFTAPWNEMLLLVEGTLSPGDTFEFNGRLDVNVVPEPSHLVSLATAGIVLIVLRGMPLLGRRRTPQGGDPRGGPGRRLRRLRDGAERLAARRR